MRTVKLLALGAALVAPIIAWGAAPLGRFDATVPGTVLDTVTRLRWERDVPMAPETQPMASARCNQRMLAGFSDWRLPTIKELASIVDEREARPALDTNFFGAAPMNAIVWSSTVQPGGAVWHLRENDGQILTADPATLGNFRCVRTEP